VVVSFVFEIEKVKSCFGVGEAGPDDSLEIVEIVKFSFEEGGEINGVDILAES
jgi:hypothetical protein